MQANQPIIPSNPGRHPIILNEQNTQLENLLQKEIDVQEMKVGDFVKMQAEVLGIKKMNIIVIDPMTKDVAHDAKKLVEVLQ